MKTFSCTILAALLLGLSQGNYMQAGCHNKEKEEPALKNTEIDLQDSLPPAPGVIRIAGRILTISDTENNRANVVIEKIIAFGSSITSPLIEKDTIQLYFRAVLQPYKDPVTNENFPGLKKGNRIVADIRETLTLNASVASYKVISYHLVQD